MLMEQNIRVLEEFIRLKPSKSSTMMLLDVLKMQNIGQEGLNHYLERYSKIKENFFQSDQKTDEAQTETIVLLSISFDNLDVLNSSDNFVTIIESYFFSLQFFIDSPETSNLLTEVLCKNTNLLQLGYSHLVQRIKEYLKSDRLVDCFFKQVFENMNKSTSESHRDMSVIRKIETFLTNLSRVCLSIPFNSEIIETLLQVYNYFNWEDITIDSETHGVITIKELAKKEPIKLEACFDEIYSMLTVLFSRMFSGARSDKLELFEETIKQIIFFGVEKSQNQETTLTHLTDLTIMKLILLLTEANKPLYFKELIGLKGIDDIMQRVVLNEDSEKRKMGYLILVHLESNIKESEGLSIWRECNGLFSQLDSFGKHLIEPLWEKVMTILIAYLNSMPSIEKENCKLDHFWYFTVLFKKALKHPNVMVQKASIEFMFSCELKLPLFNDIIVEALIPSLSNYKLYEDVGDYVDVHPKLGLKIRSFTQLLIKKYKEEVFKIFSRIAINAPRADTFNGIPSVWGIFDVIYDAGIRNVKDLSVDEFRNIINFLRIWVNRYPPYRRECLMKSILSFYGCLQYNKQILEIFLSYLSEENETEILSYPRSSHLRTLLFEVTFASSSQILDDFKVELGIFTKDPALYFKENDIGLILSKIFLLLDKGSTLFEEVFESKCPSDVISELVNALFVELNEISLSPYKDNNVFNTRILANLKTLMIQIAKSRSLNTSNILNEWSLCIIIDCIMSASDTNFDYPEICEAIFYSYLEASETNLHKINIATIGAKLKSLGAHLIQLVNNTEEDMSRNCRVICQGIIGILNVPIIGKHHELSDNFVEGCTLIYKFLTSSSRVGRPFHKSKYFIIQQIEYILGDKIISLADRKDKIMGGEFLTMVNYENKRPSKIIFDNAIFPLVIEDDVLFESFFKDLLGLFKLNKNNRHSQYNFKVFLVNDLSSLPFEAVRKLAAQYIKFINFENSAFILRQLCLIFCSLLRKVDPRVLEMKELLYIFLIKKEARPRDTSFLVEIDEFIRDTSLGEKIKRFEHKMNAYGSIPRMLTLLAIEHIIRGYKNLSEEQKGVSDQLLCYIIETGLSDFESTLSDGRIIKPFDTRHKKSLRVWQLMVVVSRMFREQIIDDPNSSRIIISLKTKILERLRFYIECNIQPSVRHYVELFFISAYWGDFAMRRKLIDVLKDQFTLRIQSHFSLLFITNYLLLNDKSTSSDFEELNGLVSLNLGSNTTFIRSLTQYYQLTYLSNNMLEESSQRNDFIKRLIIANKDNIILAKLFTEFIEKYQYILEDIGVVRILETYFIDEPLELTHRALSETLKDAVPQLKEAIYGDANRESMHQSWTGALHEIFNDENNRKECPLNENDETVFQRKIDSLLLFAGIQQNSHRNGEIAVVGSLLSKLPNLANLTRTCEIFGVKELTIPTKKILDDSNYTSVTVTAEKWLPLIEVTERDLPNYLRVKKSNGYTIIALEQTSKSTLLSSFQFPDKTVLLLGKEKEGVPLELLELVDYCVEIEQFGKIRSLNVHISAVLSIWEFAKQKFILNKE